MTWRDVLISGLLMLIFAANACPSSHAAERPPNVVFIFADDLGYGDVGAFSPDSKIATPNIDRLARQGIRLTDAHAPASVCVPSSYGQLTRRHMFRNRLGHIGYPKSASADKGETLFRMFAAGVIALLERVITWDGKEWDA